MVEGVVDFSDLVNFKPIRPNDVSEDERAKFLEGVDREMIRLGYDVANRITQESTILTERDYEARVNF
jgi:hypothetical protein